MAESISLIMGQAHPAMSLLKLGRSGCHPYSNCLSIVLVRLPSWRLFGAWFPSPCGLTEGVRVSSMLVRVCRMPLLSFLLCQSRAAPLLRLGFSGGCIGYVSCSVLQCIYPRVLMSSFLPTVLFLGLSMFGRLLCPVRVNELGICVVSESTLLRFLGSYYLPLLRGGKRT